MVYNTVSNNKLAWQKRLAMKRRQKDPKCKHIPEEDKSPNSFRQQIIEYNENTSLHGPSYITENGRHSVER